MDRDVLILTRTDVARLLDLDACIAAVADALAAHARGTAPPPGILGMPVPGGGFHIKAALLGRGRRYFAVKSNGNFPGNPANHGLPTVQGVVALCDATDGRPLALMDSIEITALRTAAATAVAAQYLARAQAAVVAVCGCGVQGRVHVRALRRVRPIRRVLAWDADPACSAALAAELGNGDLTVEAVAQFAPATRAADIVVTCTPAPRWFLGRGDVAPGALVAAVGADSENKQEIEPALMAQSTVVVDILDQAAAIGDLHHALAAGVMTRAQVHAELGQVVAGTRPGRRSHGEVIVFDSTGTALQDVAAAAVVYQRAVASRAGIRVALST